MMCLSLSSLLSSVDQIRLEARICLAARQRMADLVIGGVILGNLTLR